MSFFTLPSVATLAFKLLKKGDIVLFGSVGAGMNVNPITYQI